MNALSGMSQVEQGALVPCYSVYGLRLFSDFPFSYPLPKCGSLEYEANRAAPRVRFYYAGDPPVDWRAATMVYSAPLRTRAGDPFCVIYDLPDGEAIRISGVADFVLRGDSVLCYPVQPLCEERIELFFLGVTLARWLECHDMAALHASAISTEHGAVAFAASHRGGKSSIAATFMQAGFPLLSDDVLALYPGENEVTAYPAYPQMRMWPDHAGHFVEQPDELDFVLEGVEKRRLPVTQSESRGFCNRPRPLAVVYLPDRQEDSAIPVTIEPVLHAESLLSLIRHSFATGFANAVAHKQHRLALLAPVVERVAVRRLIYPTGIAELPRVRAAILDDLAANSGNRK